MEITRDIKHHNKHGQQRHRPRDAYELYELEHMPHALVKGPSNRAKPRAPEASKPYYFETDRTMKNHWRPLKGGDVEMLKENIDAEAEEFIALEHKKFELSKWMSMNGY